MLGGSQSARCLRELGSRRLRRTGSRVGQYHQLNRRVCEFRGYRVDNRFHHQSDPWGDGGIVCRCYRLCSVASGTLRNKCWSCH